MCVILPWLALKRERQDGPGHHLLKSGIQKSQAHGLKREMQALCTFLICAGGSRYKGLCLGLPHSPGPEELTVWVERQQIHWEAWKEEGWAFLFFIFSSFLTLYIVFGKARQRAPSYSKHNNESSYRRGYWPAPWMTRHKQRPQAMFSSSCKSRIYICKPSSP